MYAVFDEKKRRMALSTRLRNAGNIRFSNHLFHSKAQGKPPRLEIKIKLMTNEGKDMKK